jgi:glutamine synthetase
MCKKGFLTQQELESKVEGGLIETIVVAFTDHYGRLMGKRVDADYFLETVIKSGTHGCNYLLTTDMAMEPVPGYEYANWELGYGDFHLVPDLATLRIADWLEKTALVICDLHNEKSHALESIAPRSILKKQLHELGKDDMQCFAASELEYYLLENSYKQAFQQNYHNLTPAGYYLEDYHILQGTRNEKYTSAVRRHLKNSGIQVETSKGEWGLGQHELNVKYSEVLPMADNHVVYKQCMKEVADAMGLSVTFMAKFVSDQAGSSSHIHMSLWKDGKNAFAGDTEFGPVKGSDLFWEGGSNMCLT